MTNTLLLLHQTGHNLQKEWFPKNYHILSEDDGPPETFDLCLVDIPALHQYCDWLRARKEQKQPALLPVLLLANTDDLSNLEPDLLAIPDDVIDTPVRENELRLRLRTLVRAQHFSQIAATSRDQMSRIRKALESTSDAISIISMSGDVTYLNPAFGRLFGFSIEDLNQHGLSKTLFMDPAAGEAVLRAAHAGKSWQGDVLLNRKGGGLVPTLLRADSITGDWQQQLGVIIVYTDNSERKLAESIQREQRIMAEALRDTASTLTGTLDYEEVLERVLANVGKVVPHDAANIMLLNSDRANIVRYRGYKALGLEHREVIGQDFPTAEYNILRQMLDKGESLIIADTQEHEDFKTLPAPWLRSYVGTPIYLKSRVIGFINLQAVMPGFFNNTHVERLQAFAEQAAIAIQNAQLYERTQELAALEERQRLARDLHDAVSQTLFSASMIAEALPRLWKRKPDMVLPRLEQLHRLTRGALAEMRTLLIELRPTALLEANFEDLLGHLGNAVRARTVIDIRVKTESLKSELPAEVKVALYYITQEALNNIVKHARATTAAIELKTMPDGVRLTIRDDGCGFDIEQVSSTSMGLHIIRERVQDIGASLKVASHPGHGTEITVVWWHGHKEKAHYE